MSADRVVVALDQGSSSSRALAFAPDGSVIARAQFPLRSFYPKPGWVEHDPIELACSLEKAFDAVLAEIPESTVVEAVGLACQRSTFVAWDSETGKPAGRAPSWMDARAGDLVAPLQGDVAFQQDVHRRTGLYLTPFYSGPKIRHMIEESAAVRRLYEAERLKVGPVSSFLLWRWTGGRCHRVDPAMAQRMLLYNIETGDWDDRLLSIFDIPRDILPEIVPSFGDPVTLERGGRALPLTATLGDQQAAAIGQGGGRVGIGVLNYGTGAFFLLNTGTTLHRLPGLLTSVAWEAPDSGREYFLEGTVHAAGTSLDWLRENLGLIESPSDVDKAMARSTKRLLALQAIGGLGAPRWDYRTPTVFFGLDASTRGDDIVRAVAESIAFLIADIVDPMRQAGLEIKELRASGGVARADRLLAFQADLLGQAIARLEEREATAAGASKLAAWAAGLKESFSPSQESVDRVFEPGLSAEKAQRLKSVWRRFVASQQEAAAALKELGY
jgi:glycerol kinase